MAISTTSKGMSASLKITFDLGNGDVRTQDLHSVTDTKEATAIAARLVGVNPDEWIAGNITGNHMKAIKKPRTRTQ